MEPRKITNDHESDAFEAPRLYRWRPGARTWVKRVARRRERHTARSEARRALDSPPSLAQR